MRSSAIACLALLGLFLAGCRSNSLAGRVEPERTTPKYDDSVPEWVGDPLSWEKLASVEAWLATQGPYSSDFWRVEAELELAEGRLAFAQQDRQKGTLGDAKLRSRVELARRGFAKVDGDPTTSLDQERRARAGIQACSTLARPAAPPTAKATNPALGTPVVARAQWKAEKPRLDRMTRATGRWTRITVHHSAEASGTDLDGSLVSSSDAIRRIQHHAINERAFGDIGYHYLIDPEGRVFEGRALTWQGAHASGDNNVENIGVCLLGNFETIKPTPEALASLSRTLDHLCRAHGIPKSAVIPHRELRNTVCPGKELARWLKGWR